METIIILLFFVFFTMDRVVSFGLDELNVRYLRKNASHVPEFFKNTIDDETYSKTIEYTMDKGRFSRWSTLFDTLVTLWILFGGVLPWIEKWSESFGFGAIWTGVLFIFGFGVVSFVLGLPLEWISTFYIEQKHGFNKTTVGLYIKDKLKEIALSTAISLPVLYVVLWFMSTTGSLWWVWTFGFVILFQLVMLVIYPMFIAPLFNKFKPLEDGELKEALTALCRKVKFSIIGIFQMDGSKRSAHANAYFTGISKSRRIVLYDTLIKEMTVPQAVAVLAHEIGHYKLHHVKKMIVISAFGLLVGLFALGQLYDFPPFFSAFGLSNITNHAALVLFIILSKTFTFYLRPIFSAMSRKHEYEADRFCVKETLNKANIEDALLTLTKQNLSNLTPHPWYSTFYYSHPAIIERIKAIRAI